MNLTNELTRITRFLCVAGALTSAAPVFAHVVDGSATPVMQQNEFEVKGTVVDETGTPVIGANIIEKGTTNGVVTDLDGNFAFRVSNRNAVLQVSYIGYTTLEINLEGKNELQIQLKEDSQSLDELVVVGVMAYKRRST